MRIDGCILLVDTGVGDVMQTIGKGYVPPLKNFVANSYAPLRSEVEVGTKSLGVEVSIENTDTQFNKGDPFFGWSDVIHDEPSEPRCITVFRILANKTQEALSHKLEASSILPRLQYSPPERRQEIEFNVLLNVIDVKIVSITGT